VVDFALEPVTEVWDEAVSLTQANHGETGVLDEGPFDPQAESYVNLDTTGLLRLFTMRDEGVLVGYQVFIVSPHLHYPSMLWASQDVVYVAPRCRGRAAVRFMRWVDEQLKNEGAHVILRHVSRKLDFHRTLERMGYYEQEVAYVRRF
jgi:L-amino acid N-acyltransferase YncA